MLILNPLFLLFRNLAGFLLGNFEVFGVEFHSVVEIDIIKVAHTFFRCYSGNGAFLDAFLKFFGFIWLNLVDGAVKCFRLPLSAARGIFILIRGI